MLTLEQKVKTCTNKTLCFLVKKYDIKTLCLGFYRNKMKLVFSYIVFLLHRVHGKP